MEKMKHTPGPWVIEKGVMANEGKLFIEGTKKHCYKQHVCSIGYAFDADGKNLAEHNARLIASAPELLAALVSARELLETAKRYFPASIKNADTFSLLNVLANTITPAIEKATGE